MKSIEAMYDMEPSELEEILNDEMMDSIDVVALCCACILVLLFTLLLMGWI